MTQRLDPPAITFTWELALAASPLALWPLVSDTNRMNLLAGMPPARYTDVPGPAGSRRRIGTGRLLGIQVRWEEHPFRWVYGEVFSVLRTFENGPLAAYRSTVTLAPEGTGTRLTHKIALTPASGLIKPLVKLEGGKLEKRWERAYRLVDEYLAKGGAHPFLSLRAGELSPEVQAIAERLIARQQDPALVQALVELVASGNELEVQHLRPFVLADRWQRPRLEVLEACLYAAREGLLAPVWNHLCPSCRGPKASVSSREQLATEAFCASCDLTFEARGETLELAFRPDPRVRTIEERLYCVGGPGATPHVVFQGELEPLACKRVVLPVEAGTYRLRGPRQAGHASLIYAGASFPSEVVGEVAIAAGGIEVPAHPLAGPALSLELRNRDHQALPLLIERAAWADDVVTTDLLDSLPVFKDLLTNPVTSDAT